MKRWLLISLLCLIVLAAALAVVALHPRPQWTSTSPAAVAEIELGQQAEFKMYRNEACAHYAKAVALDPNFVVAKLLLANCMSGADKERVKALLDEVRKADISRLTASERFRVRYSLARWDKKYSEATRVLDEYLSHEPNDAFALHSRCTEVFSRGDWDEAARCNEAVLAINPNWALAYNLLGYIDMAKGHFAEAEKYFRAYRYIAPDQANPHDSLGELLTLVGRYDEARQELNAALQVRPDFCASNGNLLAGAMLSGDLTEMDAVVARATASKECSEKELAGMRCTAASWRHYLAADWETMWNNPVSACLEAGDRLPILTHRAAVITGRFEEAKGIEDRLRGYLDESPPSPEPGGEFPKAGLEHMIATRLLAEGNATEAIKLFQQADAKMAYRGLDQGVFKLLNLLSLAEALRAAGLPERASAVLAAVDAVNPHLAERFVGTGILDQRRGREGAAHQLATQSAARSGRATSGSPAGRGRS